MVAASIRAAAKNPVEMLPALIFETVMTEASIVPAVSLLAESEASALLPKVKGLQAPLVYL